MKAIEFLKEYENPESAKQEIIQTISGLNATDEIQASIIDRIWKLLNSDNFSNNIQNAFKITTADERMSEKNLERHRRSIAELISRLDSDYSAMTQFLKKLESGGVIDISALSSPISSFNAVFSGDSIAIKAFEMLKNYGVGENQKGPGEFALAMLSNKIRLAEGEGDTEIEGIGKVEVKSAVGPKGAGGRIGHGGATQEKQMATLIKYREYIPNLVASVEAKSGGTIGIRPFIQALNSELPASTPENKKIRTQLALDLISENFGNFAQPIANKFAQENPDEIINEYVKQNFTWYKNRDNFDAYLIISYTRQKMGMGRTGDDIIKMRQANQLTEFAISIIPSKAGSREQFAQISLSASGV